MARAGDVRPPGSDLGTARFETFLRRLFGVKGVVAPAVDPKIQAGIDLLAPPWVLAEAALLAGWRGYMCYLNVSAVAAQYTHHQILNPVNSGLLVVVERFYFSSGVAASAFYEIGTWNSGLTQRTTIARIDGRGALPIAPAISGAQYWAGATAASSIGGNAAVALSAAGATNETVGPWIVPPGFAFMAVGTAVNVGFAAGFRWYERAAEPSELAAQ